MIEVVIIISSAFLVATILKIIIKKHEKKSISDIETEPQSPLFEDIPSYEVFQKISNRCSPPNSPLRKSGDFHDYIMSGITSDKKAIENNILRTYGNYDEQ